MLTSSHQNTGQNHNLLIASKSFKYMATFGNFNKKWKLHSRMN